MKILWQFVVLLYIRETTHSYLYNQKKKKKKSSTTDITGKKKPLNNAKWKNQKYYNRATRALSIPAF